MSSRSEPAGLTHKLAGYSRSSRRMAVDRRGRITRLVQAVGEPVERLVLRLLLGIRHHGPQLGDRPDPLLVGNVVLRPPEPRRVRRRGQRADGQRGDGSALAGHALVHSSCEQASALVRRSARAPGRIRSNAHLEPSRTSRTIWPLPSSRRDPACRINRCSRLSVAASGSSVNDVCSSTSSRSDITPASVPRPRAWAACLYERVSSRSAAASCRS